MKITFLGHSGFRMEIGNTTLLVDPWLEGNPVFDPADRAKAIEGATHILISHGHGDHAADALSLAKELNVPIVGIYDMVSHWEASEGIEGVGFNKGGTVKLDDVAVTMVNATHSSSQASDNGPIYTGTESGFMIEGEGKTIYFSGDTDVMSDMEIFEELHRPDIGILCAGGHFTMDMKRAAFAAKRYFNFKTIIPCHYKTFPILEQSAEELKNALPGVDVIEPEVMKTIEL